MRCTPVGNEMEMERVDCKGITMVGDKLRKREQKMRRNASEDTVQRQTDEPKAKLLKERYENEPQLKNGQALS